MNIKLQTNIENFENGEYEGFKIGDLVKYNPDSWYVMGDEDLELIIIDLIETDRGIIACIKKREEIGKKRHSYYASVSVSNIIKVNEK